MDDPDQHGGNHDAVSVLALTDRYACTLAPSWLPSGSRQRRWTGHADETRRSRMDGRESVEQPLREEDWAVLNHSVYAALQACWLPCGGCVSVNESRSNKPAQQEQLYLSPSPTVGKRGPRRNSLDRAIEQGCNE